MNFRSTHILVFAGESQEAEILMAQLEVSGYWDKVTTCLHLEDAMEFVSQTMPALLICHGLGLEGESPKWVEALRLRGCPVVACDDQWPLEDCEVYFSTQYDLNALLACVHTFVPLSENVPLLDAPVTDSEHKYRDLFDRASDIIFLMDLETHVIIDANQRAVAAYGYTHSELVGMNFLQLVPRVEHVALWHNTRRIMTDNVILEITDRTHIRKDGTRMPVSISAGVVEIGGRKVFQDIVRDETERRQFEEFKALIEHTQYQDVLIAVNESVQAMRAPNDITDICTHLVKTLKTIGVEFQVMGVHRLMDEKKHEFETHRIVQGGSSVVRTWKNTGLFKIWKQGVVQYQADVELPEAIIAQDVLARLRARYGLPFRCILDVPFSRGVLSFLSVTPHAFRQANIQVIERIAEVFSVGFLRAEDLEALQQLERNFREMAEHIQDALYSVDAESLEFRYLSPAFEQITGYTSDDISKMGGRTGFLKFVIKEGEMADPKHAMTSLKGADSPLEGRGEIWIWCKDGTQKCLEDRWVGIRDAHGMLVSTDGVLRDVTEQKHLEAQLIQSQKMEVVGQLTGGIAHDFNNMLTGILACVHFLKEDIDAHDPRLEDVEEIRRAAVQGAALTRQLLAFSRKQIIHPTQVDLSETMSQMKKMLNRLLGEHIEINVICNDQLPAIWVDPNLVEVVILNLALNARDAMPNGGTLTLEGRIVDYIKDGVDIIPENYVLLSVRDTGIGMDTNALKRIFEPFFTTKEKGKGTGLGLATVHGIVKQSNGQIFVDSIVEQGTVFEVYLPKAKAIGTKTAYPEMTTAVSSSDGDKESLLEKRAGTVLLVEDEPIIRNLVMRLLKTIGYTVLTARHGKEALALYENQFKDIDLVMTDIVMPEMNGVEFTTHITELGFVIPIIYFSGYVVGDMPSEITLPSDALLLHKPFDMDELLEVVQKTLDN